MPLFPGSLLEQVGRSTQNGDVVGVLVVDEQGDPPQNPFPETENQQKVIKTAISMSLPIWLVELNPNPVNPNISTRTKLRALLPGNTPIITKTGWNAFDNTNLHTLLGAAAVDNILLMGFATNMCVRITATGGHTGPNNTGVFSVGATGLAYTVMTCQEILRGGAAGNWIMTPGVEFYQEL